MPKTRPSNSSFISRNRVRPVAINTTILDALPVITRAGKRPWRSAPAAWQLTRRSSLRRRGERNHGQQRRRPVVSGGVAIGTTVSNGGTVLDKGVVSGVSVLSGRTLVAEADPTPSTFTVASGGTLVIGAPGNLVRHRGVSDVHAERYTVSDGVTLDVGDNGAAIGVTISSGGNVTIISDARRLRSYGA